MTEPSEQPTDVDALCTAATEAVAQAERGHEIYHGGAIAAGVAIAKLRAAGLTWREIDKRTGIAPTTAAAWMKLAAGEGGSYVRAGRTAPSGTVRDEPDG